ncbi:hypothetical protein LX36DRAFT_442959 [Colletotrichum falcatum]|nr:hypothetical protein LX36DRAFT_442959 [Colletotrichum falcatum]
MRFRAIVLRKGSSECWVGRDRNSASKQKQQPRGKQQNIAPIVSHRIFVLLTQHAAGNLDACRTQSILGPSPLGCVTPPPPSPAALYLPRLGSRIVVFFFLDAHLGKLRARGSVCLAGYHAVGGRACVRACVCVCVCVCACARIPDSGMRRQKHYWKDSNFGGG